MANKSQDSKKTPLKQGKSLKEKRSDKATKKENKGGYSGK